MPLLIWWSLQFVRFILAMGTLPILMAALALAKLRLHLIGWPTVIFILRSVRACLICLAQVVHEAWKWKIPTLPKPFLWFWMPLCVPPAYHKITPPRLMKSVTLTVQIRRTIKRKLSQSEHLMEKISARLRHGRDCWITNVSITFCDSNVEHKMKL